MSMIKKLAKHGNSQAIVIDRAVLDLLNIDDDTPLMISTDGERLVVTPVRGKQKNQKLAGKSLAGKNKQTQKRPAR